MIPSSASFAYILAILTAFSLFKLTQASKMGSNSSIRFSRDSSKSIGESSLSRIFPAASDIDNLYAFKGHSTFARFEIDVLNAGSSSIVSLWFSITQIASAILATVGSFRAAIKPGISSV